MKNKLLIVGGIIVIVVLVFLTTSRSKGLVGDDPSLVAFGGNETKSGLLYIPFLDKTSTPVKVSVWLDQDTNGEFSESESVVQNWPLQPRKDWKNGLGRKI